MSEAHRVLLEDVRAYWDRRPCNVRHASHVNIDANPLGYHVAVMGRKYLVEPHILPFSRFEAWDGKRVLDGGCGIGTMAITFALNGAKVLAVDISPRSIEIARKRAAALHIGEDKLRFVVAPLEELARHVEPTPHDLVYSFGVLHHTPYPKTCLHNLRKFVEPLRGRLKIMLYHKVSWKVLWIALKYWRGQRGGLDELVQMFSEAQTGCPLTRTYTKRSAKVLLRDGGFLATKIGIDHIFPYNIPAYVEGRHEREWYWRWTPDPVFRLLERHFGWHMLIDAAPNPYPKTAMMEAHPWTRLP